MSWVVVPQRAKGSKSIARPVGRFMGAVAERASPEHAYQCHQHKQHHNPMAADLKFSPFFLELLIERDFEYVINRVETAGGVIHGQITIEKEPSKGSRAGSTTTNEVTLAQCGGFFRSSTQIGNYVLRTMLAGFVGNVGLTTELLSSCCASIMGS